ncbi:hypothetical protein [Conexivisphaera calida]|uniref:hypothetical protein n=1 Tax=Conexivisphaera calida TaxID=1874277 RepID=UPI00157AF4D6|nr:hypothetical protein [Conexivisphaera calida]
MAHYLGYEEVDGRRKVVRKCYLGPVGGYRHWRAAGVLKGRRVAEQLDAVLKYLGGVGWRGRIWGELAGRLRRAAAVLERGRCDLCPYIKEYFCKALPQEHQRRCAGLVDLLAPRTLDELWNYAISPCFGASAIDLALAFSGLLQKLGYTLTPVGFFSLSAL